MALTKIGTETIDGRTVDIQVDDTGTFRARLPGDQDFRAPTKKALVDQLRKAIRSVDRIAIPLTLIEESWRNETVIVRQVTVTGIHAGNHNVLYKIEGTKETEQDTGNNLYARHTPEEIAEAKRLHRAAADADQAWKAWKEAHEVSVGELIEAAQAEAVKTPATAEKPPKHRTRTHPDFEEMNQEITGEPEA